MSWSAGEPLARLNPDGLEATLEAALEPSRAQRLVAAQDRDLDASEHEPDEELTRDWMEDGGDLDELEDELAMEWNDELEQLIVEPMIDFDDL